LAFSQDAGIQTRDMLSATTSIVVSKEKIQQVSQHVRDAYESSHKVPAGDKTVLILDPVAALSESDACEAEVTFAWDQHDRMILSWWQHASTLVTGPVRFYLGEFSAGGNSRTAVRGCRAS
jgi:hypothetical protein